MPDSALLWSPDPVVGYRYWRIDVDGLRGVRGMRWVRPHLDAHCRWGVPGPVPHAAGECGPPPCGIYATKDPQDLIGGYSSDAAWALLVGEGVRMLETGAYGAVALSGRVVEHERGYRGARADVRGVVVAGGRRMVVIDRPDALRTLFSDPYPNPDRLATRHLPEVSGGWSEARLAVAGALIEMATSV
jgi:hypothetical protein